MATKPEVKLPELPFSSLLHWFYKSHEDETALKRTSQTLYTAENVKQYGALCYEAGLAAGRGQAGQSAGKSFEDWWKHSTVSWSPIGAAREAWRTQQFEIDALKHDIEQYAAASTALAMQLGEEQSLAQPAQAHCQQIEEPRFPRMPQSCHWLSTEQAYLFGCDVGYRTQLAQQPAQAAVPEGWRLVPIEPTDAMCEAAWESEGTDYVGEHHRIFRADLAYKAMLNATPDTGEG